MMSVMQEARMRAKPILPYEKFLTIIFRDFGIGMEDESFKELKYYDAYNEKLLERMSYKKIDGQWIKVDDENLGQCQSLCHILQVHLFGQCLLYQFDLRRIRMWILCIVLLMRCLIAFHHWWTVLWSDFLLGCILRQLWIQLDPTLD